jgi:hypothetical protein
VYIEYTEESGFRPAAREDGPPELVFVDLKGDFERRTAAPEADALPGPIKDAASFWKAARHGHIS